MRHERAYYGKPRSVDEATRTIEYVASTDAVDAHGTSLTQDWDLTRYTANPVVLFNHDPDQPIGTAEVSIEAGVGLVAKVTYATDDDTAERVWNLAKQGVVRGISVRFDSQTRTTETEDGASYAVLSGNSLVELSITPVPSNPETLARHAPETPPMKILFRTLGISEVATENDAVEAVQRMLADAPLARAAKSLCEITGKPSADEALAHVRGLQESAAVNAAKLKGIEDAREAEQYGALFTAGKESGQILPANEAKVRANYPTAKTLGAYLETAPKGIPSIVGAQDETRATGEKPFAEMTIGEKHRMANDDPARFKREIAHAKAVKLLATRAARDRGAPHRFGCLPIEAVCAPIRLSTARQDMT